MLTKLYVAWGVLVCGWLMTADALGWKSPTLFPREPAVNSPGGAHWFGSPYYYGRPGGESSRGSGGAWGWGGGK